MSGNPERRERKAGLFEPLWASMVDRILRRMTAGRLTVELPDGRALAFGDEEGKPVAELIIRDWRVLRRYCNHGAVGFAESYIEGEIDTPDLATLLTLFDLNNQAFDGYYGHFLSQWRRALQHRRNRNSKDGAKRNIHAHYDLGNEFFAHWLDPSMTYSSAIFKSPTQDLEKAQAAKYEHLCRQLRIEPGQHLLEIGCGWGGFAEHAAKNHQARIDSITISEAQHAFASRRIFEAGLNERVSIRLQDYRDVQGSYDRIASIEMFEAVGEAFWPLYFRKLRETLKPSGRAGLQVITIADKYFDSYRKSADFIQQYIFPGGMLPSPTALKKHAADAGLAPVAWAGFGEDYARTLEIWSERFLETFDAVRQLGFDDRFRRIWHYYLAYCQAGFRTGSTDVVQVTFRTA